METLESEHVGNSLLIKNLAIDHFKQSDLEMLKSFCIIYGMCTYCIDKVRYSIFFKKNDQGALPPTSDSLYLHTQIAPYLSLIWNEAKYQNI